MILPLTRLMQRARALAQILQVPDYSASPMLDANILKAPTMLCSLRLLLISKSYMIIFILYPRVCQRRFSVVQIASILVKRRQ